jgi:sulfur transfer protein SufE
MHISEYKDQFSALKELSPHGYEVYRWMIALGRKLQDDPLSEGKRTSKNQVTYCQYNLFVDKEDGRFKAWSDALIASGYAYMLIDIFNSASKDIPSEDLKELDVGNLLSKNRQNGFYQMVEMMRSRL